MIQKQFHVLSKSKCIKTESTPHANRESISLRTGRPEEPRAQGLCSSTKRPRRQVLRGQLAEGDERPVPTPLLGRPFPTPLRLRGGRSLVDRCDAELAAIAGAVATEVGIRGVEAATVATQAAAVIGYARAVPDGLLLLDKRRERTSVAGEAPRPEVLAHLVGGDLLLPPRRPRQELEPPATAADRLAVEPLPEVPAAVVIAEERQVAVLLGQRGQGDRVEVGYLDDVLRVANGRSLEGVPARGLALLGLRLVGTPAVDHDLADRGPCVVPLGGHEPFECFERHVHALAGLD